MDYIPLDKSWIIRLGFLDILNRYRTASKFLMAQKVLSSDLETLQRVSETWNSSRTIDVGESGTIYRFLQFASWKQNLGKEFTRKGILKYRAINNSPETVNLNLEELLKLDNGTSQWASAAVLLGNTEQILNPPYKLKLSYEAIEHWKDQRSKGLDWIPRIDPTIQRQAQAYLKIKNNENPNFEPKHSEDYCFARAFDLTTIKEAALKWPSIVGHETNRFEEMEKCLEDADQGKLVTSKDHRVVQAIAMLYKTKNKSAVYQHRDSVSKSWPEFWEFLDNN